MHLVKIDSIYINVDRVDGLSGSYLYEDVAKATSIFVGGSQRPFIARKNIDEVAAIIEADQEKRSDNTDGWCNTCEYKHLESECLGCAKYDEYDNLISLRHYKKESENK